MNDHTATDNWPGARAGIRTLLRLEGAALFFFTTVVYFTWIDLPWWLYLVLFLAPDLTFVAFLAGKRVGAMAYNAAHTTLGPLATALIGLTAGSEWILGLALIWIAHIGIDRAVGYGLRYPESFENTHLGPVGALKKELQD